MSQRKTGFAMNEYYHVYNRGVDKRSIFQNIDDVERFLKIMDVFNSTETIGSLFEYNFSKENQIARQPLVNFIAYCLNPNHYHFILTPTKEKGVERFMQRLGTGYTMYFNNKYKRSGSLFQGKFKASHIDSNEYLLHVSAYVNLNEKTHQLGGLASKLVRSSWEEYLIPSSIERCKKQIILDQFSSSKEYEAFALSSLKNILQRKQEEKFLQNLLLD